MLQPGIPGDPSMFFISPRPPSGHHQLGSRNWHGHSSKPAKIGQAYLFTPAHPTSSSPSQFPPKIFRASFKTKRKTLQNFSLRIYAQRIQLPSLETLEEAPEDHGVPQGPMCQLLPLGSDATAAEINPVRDVVVLYRSWTCEKNGKKLNEMNGFLHEFWWNQETSRMIAAF